MQSDSTFYASRKIRMQSGAGESLPRFLPITALIYKFPGSGFVTNR
jgi:hypothetical protein